MLWLIDNQFKNKQIDFSKATGLKTTEISQIKNPKHKRNLGPQTSEKIEKALGLPLGWMTQIHDFSKSVESDIYQSLNMGIVDIWDSQSPLGNQEVEVPYYMDIELSAGNGFESTLENNTPKLRFNKSYLKRRNVDPQNAVCVKVSGNSMEPKLSNGDVVAIDTASTNIVDGQTYAINHDGLLRIKRLYRLPGNQVRVNSFNIEEHPDEIITLEQSSYFKIIGRVFHSISDW